MLNQQTCNRQGLCRALWMTGGWILLKSAGTDCMWTWWCQTQERERDEREEREKEAREERERRDGGGERERGEREGGERRERERERERRREERGEREREEREREREREKRENKKIRTHLDIFWTVIGAQATEHYREKEIKTEKDNHNFVPHIWFSDKTGWLQCRIKSTSQHC